MKRFFLVLLSVCILVVSVGSSVSAAEQAIPKDSSPVITHELIAKFDSVITYTEAGGYALTGIPQGATASEVRMVKDQIALANELRQGFMQAVATDSSGKVRHQPGRVGLLIFGEDKIVYYWYGLDWYLSDMTTREIVHALNMGQGVMTILALLVVMIPPHGPAAAVALAVAVVLFQMGAEELSYRNHGRGVVVEVRFGVITGVRSQ